MASVVIGFTILILTAAYIGIVPLLLLPIASSLGNPTTTKREEVLGMTLAVFVAIVIPIAGIGSGIYFSLGAFWGSM